MTLQVDGVVERESNLSQRHQPHQLNDEKLPADGTLSQVNLHNFKCSSDEFCFSAVRTQLVRILNACNVIMKQLGVWRVCNKIYIEKYV